MIKKLIYTDFQTKKTKKYILAPDQDFTELRCPLDGTRLIYTKVDQVAVFNFCPNCETAYMSSDKEGLKKEKEEIKKNIESQLKEINEEKNNLEKYMSLYNKK